MYVCICNAVTEQAIRSAAAEGVATLDELARRTGCGDCCGTCADHALAVLAECAAPAVRRPVLRLVTANAA
jgi:bacterioferritin-associated ferredoxin